MRPRTAPAGARRLRTYAEFESYLTDFAEGRYPFLWVVGRLGVGKSESIKSAMSGRRYYYRQGGQLTPAQFYADCYKHRGDPVILDDAEHLMDNKVGRRLVSALGETTPVKHLSYATACRAPAGVPPTYTTTSPLCIIANRASAHEEIQSRAITLSFEPTNREVHLAVAAWFWDQEIHDWFGRHLHALVPLEARWYVTSDQDKVAKRDWRRIVLETRGVNRLVSAAQEVEGDGAYATREEKAARFVELTAGIRGASRATYFRLRRRLEEEGRLLAEEVPRPRSATRSRHARLPCSWRRRSRPRRRAGRSPRPGRSTCPCGRSSRGPSGEAPRCPLPRGRWSWTTRSRGSGTTRPTRTRRRRWAGPAPTVDKGTRPDGMGVP